jgi:HSP20 family protein
VSNDDFEDIFHDVDEFYKKLTKKMFREMEDIEEALRSGKLEGEWDIKPIEEPGVKGYVAQGRFELGDKRRKLAHKTLKLPERIQDEVREPLTDVFENHDNVKLYMELPGVERDDVQLNITDGRAEINAKNFFRTIDLPTKDLEHDKAVAKYRNGVLEVTIPRTKKSAEEAQKHSIKIE